MNIISQAGVRYSYTPISISLNNILLIISKTIEYHFSVIKVELKKNL